MFPRIEERFSKMMEEQKDTFLKRTDSFLVGSQGNFFQYFLIIRYSNKLSSGSSDMGFFSLHMVQNCWISETLHDRRCQLFCFKPIYLGSIYNHFDTGSMCLPALILLPVNILQQISSSSTHHELFEISFQIWWSLDPRVPLFYLFSSWNKICREGKCCHLTLVPHYLHTSAASSSSSQWFLVRSYPNND